MKQAQPDFVYFDTLARLEPPPLLPAHVRLCNRREVACIIGAQWQPRTIHARWLLHVARALWARREACANSLYALLAFVNTRHVRPLLPDLEVSAIALYVGANYSRGPRRKTKSSWQRYRVCAFDSSAPDLVAEMVM